MRAVDARRRFTWMTIALFVLAALSLACGVSGQRIGVCDAAPSAEECQACCTREGFHGHMFSSFSNPACACM